MKMGKVVCTGQDGSVGLGGWTQGGGHGPLSGVHGLGSHQVVQLTVVTVRGEILVANAQQNTDIYWALRGGGGGQYGVVTEYIVRTYQTPKEVTSGTLSIAPQNTSGAAEASWEAAALLLSELPDAMDGGLAGSATMATGTTIKKFNPGFNGPINGVAVTQVLYAYGNGSNATFHNLVSPLLNRLNTRFNGSVDLKLTASTTPGYEEFYKSISGSNAAGGSSLMSSRLLGRTELVDTPQNEIVSHIKTALTPQNASAGLYVTIGLQGGPIMANMSEERFAATNPAWRSAYLHFMAGGADFSPDLAPQQQLQRAGDWTEATKEAMWRRWAPESGAYMNEANPLNSNFQHDYYGSNYPRLSQIKEKYDPNMTLYVLSGVGTEGWTYDLNSGELCHE
jgi:FAD/FMN-containing dehydrogenase